MPAVGDRLRDEQCHLFALRFGFVHNTSDYNHPAPSQQIRQTQVGGDHDAWLAGHRDIMHANVSCYRWAVAGKFYQAMLRIIYRD